MISMNGYGIYVWPCYFLFMCLIVWYITAAVRRHTRLFSSLKQKLLTGSICDPQT